MKRYAIHMPCKQRNCARLVECNDQGTLALENMQGLVGGWIETAPSGLAGNWAHEECDRIVLIVNEEGKLRNLPINEAATDLSAVCDNIVGDTILMVAKGEELLGFSWDAAINIIFKWGLILA